MKTNIVEENFKKLAELFPKLEAGTGFLSDDGVIFISIDDNEVANLRKV